MEKLAGDLFLGSEFFRLSVLDSDCIIFRLQKYLTKEELLQMSDSRKQVSDESTADELIDWL